MNLVLFKFNIFKYKKNNKIYNLFVVSVDQYLKQKLKNSSQSKKLHTKL